jgi:hypothetical protein
MKVSQPIAPLCRSITRHCQTTVFGGVDVDVIGIQVRTQKPRPRGAEPSSAAEKAGIPGG